MNTDLIHALSDLPSKKDEFMETLTKEELVHIELMFSDSIDLNTPMSYFCFGAMFERMKAEIEK